MLWKQDLEKTWNEVSSQYSLSLARWKAEVSSLANADEHTLQGTGGMFNHFCLFCINTSGMLGQWPSQDYWLGLFIVNSM